MDYRDMCRGAGVQGCWIFDFCCKGTAILVCKRRGSVYS